MSERRTERELTEVPDAELWDAPCRLSADEACEQVGEESWAGTARRYGWGEGDEG